LVLTAEGEEKAKALSDIDIDKCFDEAENIIINDQSKHLASLLPFVYTIDNWRESGLNAYDIFPNPKISYYDEDEKVERGIQLTDKQCLDYQRLKPHEIINMYSNTKYHDIVTKWMNYLSTWCDMQENECSSFLLMATINIMEDHIYKLCLHWKVQNCDVNNRLKIFKHIHTITRLTSCNYFGGYYNNTEYLYMQYLQDLCNRRVYISVDDSDQLMKDLGLRTHPPPGFRWLLASEDNEIAGDSKIFENKLKDNLIAIYKQIVNDIKPYELEKLTEAWDKRANIMPSGAATGFKYKGQPLDKRAAHELGMIKFEEVINPDPIVYASTSMKYENGKCRYLYSNDVYDQYRTEFVLSLTEKHQHVLSHSGIGLSQTQELQKEADRIIAAQQGATTYSFDYNDYNNQHTLKYMQMHWEALSLCLQNTFGQLALDYIKILNIKIRSMENRFAGKLGPHGVVAKCLDTLFSGSRETQTLNTQNNIAYAMTIKQNIIEFFGFDAIKWVHAVGDDQIGQAISQRWAIMVILFMLVMGCEGNTNKIILGLEFLRKVYFNNGNVSGYINRSIANMVSRDQNRTERVDRHSIPESLITQLRKIVSRGGNIDSLTIFYEWVIKNRCQFVAKNKIINIPLEYIYTRKQKGGLGVKPLIGDFLDYEIKKQGDLPKINITCSTNVHEGMSFDLVNFIMKKYDINLQNAHDLLANMRQKNLINLATAEDKKRWYERINEYYSSLQIHTNTKPIEVIPIGRVGKHIYEQLLLIFHNEKKLHNYYNPIEAIQSIIAKTEIKHFDIFNNILRQVKHEKNLSDIAAMNYIFSKYLNDANLIQILQTAIAKCGIKMVIEILSDEIKYNSVLEGYVRDTVLVYVRNYTLNYFIVDNELYKYIDRDTMRLIQLMESVEDYILNDLGDGGIWLYIKP